MDRQSNQIAEAVALDGSSFYNIHPAVADKVTPAVFVVLREHGHLAALLTKENFKPKKQEQRNVEYIKFLIISGFLEPLFTSKVGVIVVWKEGDLEAMQVMRREWFGLGALAKNHKVVTESLKVTGFQKENMQWTYQRDVESVDDLLLAICYEKGSTTKASQAALQSLTQPAPAGYADTSFAAAAAAAAAAAPPADGTASEDDLDQLLKAIAASPKTHVVSPKKRPYSATEDSTAPLTPRTLLSPGGNNMDTTRTPPSWGISPGFGMPLCATDMGTSFWNSPVSGGYGGYSLKPKRDGASEVATPPQGFGQGYKHDGNNNNNNNYY